MRTSRSYLLLEVVVGLALLASLGVGLLKLQAAALRQCHHAEQRAQIATQVEQLLGTWSRTGERVTLPATGWLSGYVSWRREALPMRVDADVLPTHISVIVTYHEPHHTPRDVYRVDWLVPHRGTAGKHR